MQFITIKITCSDELTDILIAELFEIGFDSFQEFDDGFEGSCEEEQFSEDTMKSVLENYPDTIWKIKEQDKVNWNEEWEKNYDPVIVNDRCMVRATFHPKISEYEYDIVVNPKMSFGTGHHATTWQMLAYQMDLDHSGMKVLDVGSGTGILAIMAAKRGAASITITDIDDWCIENSQENFSLNQLHDIKVLKGQIEIVEEKDFDIIIANINKNILMDQIGKYAERLKSGGLLLLSGFYSRDSADLTARGEGFGLSKKDETSKDDWAMLALIKQFV